MRLYFKIIFLILVVFAINCSSSPLIDDEPIVETNPPKDSTENTGNSDIKLFGQPLLNHPRLLFTKAEEKKLLERLPQDQLLSDLVDLLRVKADEQLNQPIIEYPSGPVNVDNSILPISREHLYRLITLGMAYRIFDDVKYADKAIEHIINVCNYPKWNPDHFLDVAEMAAAVAIGYDWLYPVLNEDQKVLIVKTLKDKAISLAVSEYITPQTNSWSTRETNWNTVCNSGISLAALAVAEEYKNEFPNIPELVINHATKYIPNNLITFKPDGVAFEGPAYAEYTINYFTLISKALNDNFSTDKGLSQVQGINKFADFYFQTLSPTNQIFTFADARTSETSKSPFFFFYSNQYDQPHLSSFYKDILRDIISGKRSVPKSIFFLSVPWYDYRNDNDYMSKDKLNVFQSPINPIAVFNGQISDPHSIYLIAKGGKPNEPHQHLDMGSFIVENQGLRWFEDLGAENYNLPGFWQYYPTGLRWRYFRNSSLSHNVPSIDNQIQYSATRALIDRYDKSVENPFAIFDLDSAYINQAESVTRGFKMIDNSVMLLQDEFLLSTAGQQVTETFLTRANIIIESSITTLYLNGKSFYIKVLEPENIHIEKVVATRTTEQENPINGYHLLKISKKTVKNDEKIVFKILLSSDRDKLNSITSDYRLLNDW